MTESKWKCPDCEDDLETDDESEGSLTVCMSCLAIITTEGGDVKLTDYNQLDVQTRAMIIQGISMGLAQMALRELMVRAEDSEAN